MNIKQTHKRHTSKQRPGMIRFNIYEGCIAARCFLRVTYLRTANKILEKLVYPLW